MTRGAVLALASTIFAHAARQIGELVTIELFQMLKIVHKARHGVLLAYLDERVAVAHRHAREHGNVEDADDAQDDGDSAGNRRLGRDIAKADCRDGFKAKPETIAKRKGRGLGQPNGRRAQQKEDKKQARDARKASLAQHVGKRPQLVHRDPFSQTPNHIRSVLSHASPANGTSHRVFLFD